MRPVISVSALLAVALVAGCRTEEPAPFSVVSYNAGLAVGFVPAANERAPAVAEALAALDVDVICVQEVWEPEHVQALRDAAAETFPHTFFPVPNQVRGEEPGCADGDLDRLLTCMEEKCSDACVDDLPTCLLESCPLQFVALPKDCMRCAQANVGGTPEEIRETCESELTEYAYGGSFGTGILSKHPISATEELLFESTTNRRSALHAVVEIPGGAVDVYCTHLSAIFAVIPYPREEGSWAEEQRVQIEQLVDWIDATATHDTVVLMGDMNSGPDVGDSRGEYPEHYALLSRTGMVNPYVESEGPCTFCSDNKLTSADSDEADRVIDHVFVKGHTSATASRILTDPIQTETCGVPMEGHLSDHYGVRVDIER